MDWTLENPRKGIKTAKVSESINGKHILYVEFSWSSKPELIGDYLFPSDSAAKRYYSTNFQKTRDGCEKPRWKNI